MKWSLNFFKPNLKKRVKMHPKNQTELANILGIKPQLLSAYISNNSNTYPSIEKIVDLCNELNCSPNELFRDPEHQGTIADVQSELQEITNRLDSFKR